jgi:hypothetical protein
MHCRLSFKAQFLWVHVRCWATYRQNPSHMELRSNYLYTLKEFNVHGSVHRKNILIYIQQDAMLHSLFHLETAPHVSGGTTTHHQERKQPCLQHLVFVTLLLLSATIVEELEPVWVCCGWHTPPTAHSNQIE